MAKKENPWQTLKSATQRVIAQQHEAIVAPMEKNRVLLKIRRALDQARSNQPVEDGSPKEK